MTCNIYFYLVHFFMAVNFTFGMSSRLNKYASTWTTFNKINSAAVMLIIQCNFCVNL